jgi:hypothetical protein
MSLSWVNMFAARLPTTVSNVRTCCRLLWGQAGQSNALAIAEGLGFSRQIVADARKVIIFVSCIFWTTIEAVWPPCRACLTSLTEPLQQT